MSNCSEQLNNEAEGLLFKTKEDLRVTKIGKFIHIHSLATALIGMPDDGESTESLSHPENSSLDLQKFERRPGTSLGAQHHYLSSQFLSSAVSGGLKGVLERSLCARTQAPFACVGMAA